MINNLVVKWNCLLLAYDKVVLIENCKERISSELGWIEFSF